MLVHQSVHLSKYKQIQSGSYFTPPDLVELVFDFIKPYIKANKGAIVFDNAAGCGAFITKNLECDFRVSDNDIKAVNFLRIRLPEDKVFNSNSLINVNRKNYRIGESDFLIQIGNPPYNDTTSEFKNGLKGKNECDADLFDRDLGVSFLKSYNKLNADIVCVLHPLSYLIKSANFNRLKEFKENYRLKKGLIFSSSLFPGTGSIKFPIIIGLYERNPKAMDFEYINNFEFDVLNRKRIWRLKDYETTDGYINKYPARKGDTKISPISTYYYTFRDFNSLKKNASFMGEPHYNGIIVTVENFYKYAYLYALKTFFKNDDEWLYGNLSPLVNREKLERSKRIYVLYALQTHPTLSKLHSSEISEIKEYYFLDNGNFGSLESIKDKIRLEIESLVSDKQFS